MTTRYEKLLQPAPLAPGITARNPLAMAPMTTSSGNPDGTVSAAELSYYRRRAKDIGIVITATTYVTPSGKGFHNQFAAHSDGFIPSLKTLADTIKGEGALAVLQIFHCGRMASPAEVPGGITLSASAVAPLRPGAHTPREMSEQEIQDTIKAFGETAVRAIKAGFDGVEIHGANTYLLQQFFSPHSNRREDHWGGTLEKRMNFPLAVIAEVKEAVKKSGRENFIIGYRFSPEEMENSGITLEDTLLLVDTLSKQGLSYLHVSLGNFWQSSLRDKDNKDPVILKLIDKIQKRVPFFGVGSIHTPEEALKALESGVDFLCMGREMIMEPEWISKIKTEKISEIRTTLSKKDRDVLDIPEQMLNYILSTPGRLPVVE